MYKGYYFIAVFTLSLTGLIQQRYVVKFTNLLRLFNAAVVSAGYDRNILRWVFDITVYYLLLTFVLFQINQLPELSIGQTRVMANINRNITLTLPPPRVSITSKYVY